MKGINKYTLSYKIFLTVSVVLSSLLILSGWIIYTLTSSLITSHLNENLAKTVEGVRHVVEKSAALSIRSYLRASAEQYLVVADYYYGKSIRGEITEEQAKEAVSKLILAKRIGESGYVYVLDSLAVVKVHPDADVTGRDIHDELFARKQVNQRTGFLEYSWKNPQDREERQKLLYMAYFKPWDWIISVTAYREELAKLVQPQDFKDEILSIKVSENGYPFVIDQQGNVIAHPQLLGNVFSEDLDFSEFMKNLVHSKKGKQFYDWLDPLDNQLKPKIVAYDTIEEFGWLVAATGYVNDFYAPLKIIQNVFFALLVTGLLLAVLISYFLSRSITSPLNLLLQELSAHSEDIGFKPPNSKTKNEIESLSAYFSGYIEQLEANNRKLNDLYVEQHENSLNLSIFKEVFDNIVEGISITDSQGIIVLTNPAFTKITGYSPHEALGQNPRILKSDRHPELFYRNMWKQLENQGFWTGEIWNKRRNGEVYPEWLTISAIKTPMGQVTHYAAVFNDISTLIEQKDKIQFLAYHDHLTNLPNRLTILERMKQLISEQKRQGGYVVCIVIDLDNFKPFNDSMGQEYGDLLLKEYVERTTSNLRTEDILGRIGGDDFILMFTIDQKDNYHILPIVDRLYKSIETPFQLAGHKIHITLNIGIAVYPDNAATPDELLKRANLALHKAQEIQGNSYSFFSSEMEQSIKKRLHYLDTIRIGIDNEDFIPYFQPKVDLKTGQVRGVEALARWKIGSEFVSPGEFIPIAEESGLLIPLSNQIYQKAFQQTLILRNEGHNIHVSVNLSPAQFQDDYLIDNLLTIQKESGLETKFIELEITESLLVDNVEDAKAILDTLSVLGFTISIDDFGTGYSSLQYLKQLPLNTLKIDMSFVSGIGVDKNDENLVQTISLLAKQFGLSVVAEGVERQEQIDFLLAQGCDVGQGYLYGRPMDCKDISEWLNSRK